MDGPVILYLHGFCSSPASWKVRLLQAEMERRGLTDRLLCPALPPVPEEALACAARLMEQVSGPVTLIGSSLGGHYATWLAEQHDCRAALINPAVVDRLAPDRFLGEHENFHTGERFLFTAAHAAQLAAQVVPVPTPSRYLLLVETADEVLDCREAITRYAGCRQIVLEGGDHSFTQFPNYIAQLIEFAGL